LLQCSWGAQAAGGEFLKFPVISLLIREFTLGCETARPHRG
jgi:hypothetical protein